MPKREPPPIRAGAQARSPAHRFGEASRDCNGVATDGVNGIVVSAMHRDAYTATEWATLEYAILWVFEAVAGADGTIDGNEVAALTKAAYGASNSKNSLLRELWGGVYANLDAIRVRYHDDPRDISTGLKQFMDLIGTKAAPAEAEGMRRELMKFGADVARASGGFLGFGEKMSPVERQGLVMLSELLNTPFDPSV